jgi:endonuclease/exonuclease/phosphatase family metal-dependent hydrolase
VSTTGWWRNPYMASFRAGSFDFVVVSAHIRWGANAKERLPELDLLARWVQERGKDPNFTDKDLVAMGDFNIPSRTSDLFAAITRCGLKIPAALLGRHGSNLGRDRSYDQILHDATYKKSFTNHGGVLDFYAGNHQPLFPARKLTKTEFTYQLSDHLPLWIQINTDTERERLEQVLNGRV